LWPEIEEKIVEISSGREVPKATIVKPITKSPTFSFLARAEAWPTKISADFTKTNRLIMIIIKVVI